MLSIECKNQFVSSISRQPWLIEVHEKNKPVCTYISPSKGIRKERYIPEMQGKKCLGCSGEWVLLIDKRTRGCFYLSLLSYMKVHLPPLPDYVDTFGTIFLASSPTSHDSITTFVPIWGTIILIYHMHDKTWTKLSISSDRQELSFNNDIHIIYKGRLFLFNYVWKIFVYDFASLIEGRIEMTLSYPFHDYPLFTATNKYFVESCESLYLVRIHLFGDGQNITHIEVYQLYDPSEKDKQDQEGIYWNYVSSIGDQAFFLSRMYSQSICANEVGAEPNCIYITLSCSDGERLYKFCLEDQTLSFRLLVPEDKRSSDSELFWTVPLPGMQDLEFDVSSYVMESNKESVSSEKNLNNIKCSRRWNDLPTELVESLFQQSSLVDSIRVTTVCKSWSLASEFIPNVNSWPWLMHSPNIFNGICKFFDPINGKEYRLQKDVISAKKQVVFHSSRDGWVVISEGSDAIIIMNPMTEEVINLPPLDVLDYQCISFIGVPTSSDFRVFAFDYEYNYELAIHSWHLGQEMWMKKTLGTNTQFHGAMNNPVLFKGELCCLDSRGRLGVFNPDKMTWRVLTKPEPIYLDLPVQGHACCALLEVHDYLVAVFRTDDLNPIRVFKLDQSKMTWAKIEDLGDITLFVGLRNSLAVPSPFKSCRNGIFLPKFDGRDHSRGVFYSMDDRVYYPRFYDVEEPTTYVWFKPNRTIAYKE